MYLITGGSGQLGGALTQIMNNLAVAPTHKELDITNRDKVFSFVKENKPSVIINCAAYNAVDKAENDVKNCMAVNYLGTKNVVEAAAEVGAYLIFISTDFVFDGEKKTPYETYDKVSPLSFYGRSKVKGEEVALSYENSLVLRTSWLFSKRENNFVHAVLKKAMNNESIAVVSDQVGSPTYAADLAETINRLIKIRPTGILHATNEGVCSRFEFAQEVLRQGGFDCEIHSVSSKEYMSPAPRPAYSVLSKKCLDQIGVDRLPDWHDALRRYFVEKELNR